MRSSIKHHTILLVPTRIYTAFNIFMNMNTSEKKLGNIAKWLITSHVVWVFTSVLWPVSCHLKLRNPQGMARYCASTFQLKKLRLIGSVALNPLSGSRSTRRLRLRSKARNQYGPFPHPGASQSGIVAKWVPYHFLNFDSILEWIIILWINSVSGT